MSSYAPSIIRVHGLQLAAGDVVRVGIRKLTIVHICEPFLTMKRGTQRRALVLEDGQGKPTPFTFDGFSLKDFEVIGGPKIAAARRWPSLVKWMPSGYARWTGGIA